jgi:hypothetical protein
VTVGGEGTSAFAGDPQPVEVFHRGTWYTGELLGWRHDDDGRCRARVRCLVNGLRHSAWVDLADLRLPRTGTTALAPDDDPAPVAVSPHSRPPVPPRIPGRHRALDDETQPHLLLATRPARPRPPGVTLPPPRYPRSAPGSGLPMVGSAAPRV